MKKNYFYTIGATMLLLVSQLKAQETKDADFKPSGNLYGYVFGDYAYKTHNDTLQRGAGNVQYRGTNSLSSANTSANTPAPAQVQTNAFQIRRVYLGYDYQFAPNLTASVLLANEQTQLPNGQNTVYLKYANVKWSNIFKNSDLVIGQFQTCSFATAGNTEPLGGYRVIERTIMDLHSVDGATDLGLSLQGKAWSQQTPDSLKPSYVGYMLQVGNGSSATPETDIFKKFRGNVYASLLKQKLTIGFYGDYATLQYSPYHTSNMTFKAYVSYKTEGFRIGAEVFQQTNKNSDIYKVSAGGVLPGSAINDTATGMQMGWSVFASETIIKNKLNIFARYDMYNPNTKWNSNNVYSKAASAIQGSNLTTATFYTQTFLTAGLDWTPNPRMHIMPNLWYNGYKTMMTTIGSGGTGGDLSGRVKSDNDLVYRLTFYFIFNASKKVANNGMSY
jgi:hypothetical protein